MSACCDAEQKPFDGQSRTYRRALWAVIGINAAMFLVELGAGWSVHSKALHADALDFLADTATYGITMLVIGMSPAVRSWAALTKGLTLSAVAAWVLGSTIYAVVNGGLPQADVMGGIGLLALVANLSSVALLLRFRNGDANVRSVWLCSRNDAIGNIAVMIAAAGVWGSNSAWPDLLVAGGMATLFLWSSIQIAGQARRELQSPVALPVQPESG